MKNCRLEIDLA